MILIYLLLAVALVGWLVFLLARKVFRLILSSHRRSIAVEQHLARIAQQS